MSWQKLVIHCGEHDAELISDHLTELGAESVCFTDLADQALFDPPADKLELWRKTQLSALFPQQTDIQQVIAQLGEQVLKMPEYYLETLADKIWERQWLQDFKPMCFGHKLWICPSHCTAPDPKAVNVTMDPGLAFGSGTHATTGLCLQWLSQHLTPGQRLLDYGCGSGILAIAAAKLGAEKVWATDIDPQALWASRENADRNHIGEQIFIMGPQQLPEIQAHVVVANILLKPLIELATSLINYLEINGSLVLSGILIEQIPSLTAAYEAWIQFDEPLIDSPWVVLSGVRRA